MAQIDTNAAPVTGNILTRAFSAIGQFFMDIADAQSRAAQFNALNDLSDEELKNIGLSRHEIGQHVFRDKLFM